MTGSRGATIPILTIPQVAEMTLSLYTTTIDPPSPSLLAFTAPLLHLSAAGGYIDKILEDLDQREIMADGSTELGRLTNLRIQGFWDGHIRAH